MGSLFYDDKIFSLFGSGNGSFYTLNTCNVGKLPSTIALDDFNYDGLYDIAVVSILSGNDDFTFSFGANFIAGNRPAALISADINNDGKIDIAVANWYTNDVTTMLNNLDTR